MKLLCYLTLQMDFFFFLLDFFEEKEQVPLLDHWLLGIIKRLLPKLCKRLRSCRKG